MKKRRTTLIIVIIVLVVLAGLIAGAALLYGDVVSSMLDVLNNREPTPTAPLMEVVTVRRGDLEETVRVLGAVSAPGKVSLTFNSDWGQVAEVLVKPGATVQAGAPLARLDATRLRQQVESAKTALQRAQTELTKAKQPLSALEMAQKRLAVQTAQTKVREEAAALKKLQEGHAAKLQSDLLAARQKLASARVDYAMLKAKDLSAEIAAIEERYAPAAQRCAELAAKPAPNAGDSDLRWLVCNETTDGADEIARLRLNQERALLNSAYEIERSQRAVTKAEKALAAGGPDPLEIAAGENAVAEAEARLASAQDDLKTAEAGPAPAALLEKEAAVQSAQRLLDEAQNEWSHATLTATVAGTVTQVGVAVGDWVDRSNIVAEIADLSNLRVLAEVDETEIRKFSAGQPVRVSFDALPGQKFQGKIELVPIQGALNNDVLNFQAPVQLTDPWPAGLRLGMTASLEVIVQSATDILLAPAAAVRQIGDGYAVTLMRVNPATGVSVAERRFVKVGRSNGLFTEITDGLQEGDQVQVQYEETGDGTTNGS